MIDFLLRRATKNPKLHRWVSNNWMKWPVALLEIIEDRHGRASTIVVSQLPVTKWFETIGDSTIADAILDRLVHTAHRIELKGESMRKKQ